ncbi:competence type IV pilus assembly protein ComGB [Ornithinibacillus salinisoli]|uniref:Competence type IV pilus assembly protein ComGB n=1 Tax=Ornithinibacillus salinisoli TaxID=1848459 RepID=A0ABW4W566_9BACI
MDLLRRKHLRSIRKKSLKSDLQLRFLHRLARSLNNGYSLLRALETIKWDPSLEETADQVIIMLRNGDPIDHAFQKVGFHSTICSYLFLSRSNGDLPSNLANCMDMYEKRIGYVKKFEQIIRYPLILLIIFTLLVFFLNRSILPTFIDLFQSSPQASSSIEFSLYIIEFMSNLISIAILILVGLLLFWRRKKHSIPIEKRIRIYQAIPFYKYYLKMQTSFLFATHLSSLLSTGMSIKDIFTILSQQQKLPIISFYAKNIVLELSKGSQIIQVLTPLPLLEKQLIIIFQKNTDAYSLEKDLSIYAQLLTEEIHRKIMKMFTYIQPVFYVILAIFIIFIYLTLMWPMFQLIDTI